MLSSVPPDKARLPKLVPNVNRRAQQIISSHVRSSSVDTASSTATVPVLVKINSTAPKTARTHDISHLHDVVKHLQPCIPATLIDPVYHEYEASFLPKDSSSMYSEVDGLWHTRIFPSNTPSSRKDAVLLDAWITQRLELYQKSCSGKEDLAQAVEDLVPILSVALHEIVRQVTHHTAERGIVLQKLWRTYVELFERVLQEMHVSLQAQKTATAEVQKELNEAHASLEALLLAHPEKMQQVIAQLEASFTLRHKEVDEELKLYESETATLRGDLRKRHNEIEMWYPSFALYQESYIKSHIPQMKNRRKHHRSSVARGPSGFIQRDDSSVAHGPSGFIQRDDDSYIEGDFGEQEEELAPEVAIAEDFKRLLTVLAPEKRKFIGKELSDILSMAGTVHAKVASPTKKKKTKTVVEKEANTEDAEQLKALQVDVRHQELRIRELREEIMNLEFRLEESHRAKLGFHDDDAKSPTGKAKKKDGGESSADDSDASPIALPQGGVVNHLAGLLHREASSDQQNQSDGQPSDNKESSEDVAKSP